MNLEIETDVGLLEQALRLAREVRARALAAGEELLAETEGKAIARIEQRLVLLQTGQGQVVIAEGEEALGVEDVDRRSRRC